MPIERTGQPAALRSRDKANLEPTGSGGAGSAKILIPQVLAASLATAAGYAVSFLLLSKEGVTRVDNEDKNSVWGVIPADAH